MGIVINKSQSLNSLFSSPLPSGPNTIDILPSKFSSIAGSSSGFKKWRKEILLPFSLLPEVPTTRLESFTADSISSKNLALSNTDCACLALFLTSSDQFGSLPTILKSKNPKFIIERATAPIFPSNWGLTNTIETLFEYSGAGTSSISPI